MHVSLFKSGLKSFVQKLKTTEINEKNIEKSMREFKILLIKNSVGSEVANVIIQKTKEKMIGQRAERFSNMRNLFIEPFQQTILEIITPKKQIDFLDVLEDRKKQGITKPLVILFLGINGTGKTTTIAKIAYLLNKEKYRLVIAAADTFRSGAQEQIKEHADRLKIKCIEGKYGSDPSSIAYDAIQHATARNLHVVLIDTAGRMAINHDLIGEMKKIKRVAEPDLTFYIGDALTGNDAVNQARDFNNQIGIDGTILCKMDADEKSGAVISVSYATGGKPIAYAGVGQSYKDLEKFDPNKFIKILFEDL